MSARIGEWRFPQLADQVRCSTGYTMAPGGVLKLPAGWGSMPRAETPGVRDLSIAPKPKRGRPAKIKGDL